MSDFVRKSDVVQILKECKLDETLFEKDVFDKINNLPIAYFVDKVIEELETMSQLITIKDMFKVHENVKMVATDIAIEIVKQGGVSDDVCEWKYTREIMDNAEFKIGCNQNPLKRGIVPNNFSYQDFKYCPYCGKKIKVVE